MLTVSVKADIAAAQRALTNLAEKQLAAAAVRAVNKAAVNVRAEAVREVRQRRALPASTVRNAFVIRRASRQRMIASVEASGRPVPLRDYKARETQKGVTVQVQPKQPRSLVSHKGNRAFVVKKIGEHVFARQGKKRLPIKKLYGPSIPTAITSEAALRAIEKFASDSLEKRLAEEIRYELLRARRR